jgi:HK97 family phage prohead protease
MTDALRFSRGIEIKRTDVSDKGTFAGYASTFGGEPDRGLDIIAAGAFRSTLADYQKTGARPALLWHHDMSEPVGVWTSLREDERGLKGEGKLTLDVPRGRDAHALMRDGALYLSIGYNVRPGGATFANGVRTLNQIDLFEVSLVAAPANPRAHITAVKALIDGPAELQRALQEHLGYSQREAKRIVAGGWAALQRTDDNSDELAEVLAELKRFDLQL